MVEVRDRRARRAADGSVSASVLQGERLRAPGLGAAELLRGTPGVQVTESGGLGAPASVSLRGATAAQTPVYLAGVRLNDEQSGVADLGSVPPWFVRRVEVYRSHAPLAADRLGLGGAIFFEPREPEGGTLGAGALGGSWGTRAGWVLGGAGDAERGVVAGFQLAAADNDYPFADDRGTLFVAGDDRTARLPNADATQLDGWLAARERLGRARFSLVANRSTREQGAPKLAAVPSRLARAELERTLISLGTRVPMGESAWLGASTGLLVTGARLADPGRELGLQTLEVETESERLSERVEVGWSPTAGLLLHPVVDLSSERLRRWDVQTPIDRAAPALVARREAQRLATGVVWAPGERLSLVGLGAIECHGTSTAGARLCTERWLTGRAGPVLELGSTTVHAALARGVRPPTLGELHGASLLVRGNPRLGAETGLTAEVGARFAPAPAPRAPAFFADAAAFARWSEDHVTLVRAAQGYLFPRNLARARTLGGELGAGLTLPPHLELEGGLALLDARDTTPGRTTANDLLPFQSRLTTSGALRGLWPAPAALVERAFAELRFTHQGSRYSDPAGLAVIPEQASVDAELGVVAAREVVSARFRVVNLFDAARWDVVGYPLPGRSVFGSVEARW